MMNWWRQLPSAGVSIQNTASKCTPVQLEGTNPSENRCGGPQSKSNGASSLHRGRALRRRSLCSDPESSQHIYTRRPSLRQRAIASQTETSSPLVKVTLDCVHCTRFAFNPLIRLPLIGGIPEPPSMWIASSSQWLCQLDTSSLFTQLEPYSSCL